MSQIRTQHQTAFQTLSSAATTLAATLDQSQKVQAQATLPGLVSPGSLMGPRGMMGSGRGMRGGGRGMMGGTN
jgi:hypothetical protein